MEKKTDLNSAFLTAIQTSFNRFIESKTSRSTAKLKPLHGRIAEDLATKLGEGYKIWSQGWRWRKVCYAELFAKLEQLF